MTTQDDVRQDLDDEIFNSDIAKTVTLISKSALVYNSRGEQESVTNTSSSISVVLYDINHSTQAFQPWSNVDEGDMQAAIRYDVVINKGDYLTIEGEDWIVKEINKNYLPDNVVTIARIARVQN